MLARFAARSVIESAEHDLQLQVKSDALSQGTLDTGLCVKQRRNVIEKSGHSIVHERKIRDGTTK